MSQDRWRGRGWIIIPIFVVAVLIWRSATTTNAPAKVADPRNAPPSPAPINGLVTNQPAIDVPAPLTAREVAVVMYTRRKVELNELRAGRGSADGRQILWAGIAEYRNKQPNASIAQAKDATLRRMEEQLEAIYAAPSILQQMQPLIGQVQVQSEPERAALLNERAQPVSQPGLPPAQPMNDAALAQLLVGGWRQTNADGISTTISFQPNGTWSMYVSSTKPLVNLPAVIAGEVSGLWSVRGGHLAMECRQADEAFIGVFVIGRVAQSPIGVLGQGAIQLTGVEGDTLTRTYQRIR